MEEIYCFAGNPLDRASERRRDTEWVASLFADPAARILPLRDLRPLTRDRRRSPALDWQKVAPWRELIERGATLIFLGLGDEGPRFAVDASGADSGPAAASEAFDARTLAPLLPGGEAAILAEARSLIDWHARHRFCAQCGSPTRVESAGWVRRCPECRASHFPRTDPVVIMLAVRGEYGLLGRNRRRAGNRFSCLAGFMEPGETLEEARSPRDTRGIRDQGRPRALSGVSALAVSVEPDDRLSVRGADRGDHGRSRRSWPKRAGSRATRSARWSPAPRPDPTTRPSSRCRARSRSRTISAAAGRTGWTISDEFAGRAGRDRANNARTGREEHRRVAM